MKPLSLLFSIAAVLVFLNAPASAGGQPNMHAALDALRRAHATHSIEDLEAAKLRLSHAKPNKAGFRVDAMEIIDKAVAQMNAGKYAEADKSITLAIGLLEKGVAAGQR